MRTDYCWALMVSDEVRLPVDFGTGAVATSFRSFRLYLSAGQLRLQIPSGPDKPAAVLDSPFMAFVHISRPLDVPQLARDFGSIQEQAH